MSVTLQNQPETKTTKPDFGKGRYSGLMEEVWNDCQTVFQSTSDEAEKIARKVASDMGAIMAQSPVEVRLGKVNKDGKLTISEACKVKGITITNAIYALKALHYAGEAGKNGFSFAQTSWHQTDMLATALKELTQ